jgi:hypothetical protein
MRCFFYLLTQVGFVWQHQAVAPAVVLESLHAPGIGQQAHSWAQEEVSLRSMGLA